MNIYRGAQCILKHARKLSKRSDVLWGHNVYCPKEVGCLKHVVYTVIKSKKSFSYQLITSQKLSILVFWNQQLPQTIQSTLTHCGQLTLNKSIAEFTHNSIIKYVPVGFLPVSGRGPCRPPSHCRHWQMFGGKTSKISLGALRQSLINDFTQNMIK